MSITCRGESWPSVLLRSEARHRSPERSIRSLRKCMRADVQSAAEGRRDEGPRPYRRALPADSCGVWLLLLHRVQDALNQPPLVSRRVRNAWIALSLRLILS